MSILLILSSYINIKFCWYQRGFADIVEWNTLINVATSICALHSGPPPQAFNHQMWGFLKRGPIPSVLAFTPTQPNNALIETISLLLMTRIGWGGVDVGQVGDNFSVGEDWSGGDFLCARAPQIENFLCARARTIVQRLTHVWIILLAYSCSTGHHALICAMPGLTSHNT